MRPDPFRPQPLPIAWELMRASRPQARCFADETAIDFPSVHDLMARERDTFLGERRASGALATAVTLTPREARLGAVVPLDVLMRSTCAECGGRGETWAEACAACQGTGDWLLPHVVRLAVPAGVADGARFRFRVVSPDAPAVRVDVRIAVRPVS